MNVIFDNYVDITGRIKSGKRYCAFLASEGSVWDQPEGGGPWRNITEDALRREQHVIAFLERLRMRLYPERARREEGAERRH
jgi:hypothetical protein